MNCFYAKVSLIINAVLVALVIALVIFVLYLHHVQDLKIREIDFKIDTHINPISELID